MSIRKDQNQSSISNVGLYPQRLLGSDSVRSPTSPLDAKVIPNADNPRSSSLTTAQKRSWDCSKVGLSIVESLEDRARNCGKFLLSSPERKKISLSPQMMVKKICVNPAEEEESKSLPKETSCKVPESKSEPVIHNKGESNVVFEIGDTAQELGLFVRSRSCPLNSYKTFPGLTSSKTDSTIDSFGLKDMSSSPHFIGGSSSHAFPPAAELNSNTASMCSSNEYLMSLSPSEIELSEDYTCVITHGPNPKITHIFGDCILETNAKVIKNYFKIEGMDKGMNMLGGNMMPPPQAPNQYSSSEYFLNFCHHCNKKLDKKEDIYIYGGDKAFCSLECREVEIKFNEELEKSKTESENSPKAEFGVNLFEPTM